MTSISTFLAKYTDVSVITASRNTNSKLGEKELFKNVEIID